MLPAAIEEDNIERDFEKFDKEMNSIDQSFEKLEGKIKRLSRKKETAKLNKTAVIMEVNQVAKNPNVPKS